MHQTSEPTPADRHTGPTTPAPVWWLEDPFGSIITGMIAPAVAVTVLAAVIAALAATY